MFKQIGTYLPILVFLGLSGGLALALMLVSWLRAKQKPYHEKLKPYECGFDAFELPEENTRNKFEIQFYRVAILFILFDLEIAFLFPWALVLKKIGWFGFYSMITFLFVMTVGFLYEWKKGGLEWQ